MKYKSPCLECIVRPICLEYCFEERMFREKLGNHLEKHQKHVYSKNKRIRKKVKDCKRKQWNTLVTSWNEHIRIINSRIEREKQKS